MAYLIGIIAEIYIDDHHVLAALIVAHFDCYVDWGLGGLHCY